MKAIVLAAGRGTRLGELTEHTPKPMVKVRGRTVIEQNLQWLASYGVREVGINLHHLGGVIERHLGDGSRFGVSIRYYREEKLMGTAGALKAFEEWLSDGPFLVVYGDNLFDFDLRKLQAEHAETAAVATLALFAPESPFFTGIAGGRVEMDRSGRILRFVEGRVDAGLTLVNAGCYVVESSLLQHIPAGHPSDFGHDLFPKVLRNQGLLGGHLIEGWCLGLDTPDALSCAQRFLGEGAVDER